MGLHAASQSSKALIAVFARLTADEWRQSCMGNSMRIGDGEAHERPRRGACHLARVSYPDSTRSMKGVPFTVVDSPKCELAPKRRGSERTSIRRGQRGFTLIELMIVVMIVGILAVLAIYGVRKYIANSKTAEARNSLGQVGKDSQTAFERESMAATVLGAFASTAVSRALCGPGTQTVPSAIGSVAAHKYQSNQAPGTDWSVDQATPAGFACIKFTMSAPQYYVYGYTSDGSQAPATVRIGTNFTASANGDLDGNGTQSTFQLYGSIANGQLYVSPNLYSNLAEE
jgi:type IV pilus assembly protein PilA